MERGRTSASADPSCSRALERPRSSTCERDKSSAASERRSRSYDDGATPESLLDSAEWADQG
jgi:hypothetical protein